MVYVLVIYFLETTSMDGVNESLLLRVRTIHPVQRSSAGIEPEEPPFSVRDNHVLSCHRSDRTGSNLCIKPHFTFDRDSDRKPKAESRKNGGNAR
jgi:hypothetical protein